MAMNIPLSLVTTANKNAPTNSPVMWDGSDVVVSKEHLINLERLRADLNMLVTKQAEYSKEFEDVNTSIESIKNSVYDVQSNHTLAIKKIEGAVRDTSRLNLDVTNNVTAMDSISTVYSSNATRLTEAEKIANLVKSGNLFKVDTTSEDSASSKNLHISKSRLGEYVFVDSAIEDTRLLPGKNVTIQYSLARGNYGISFQYPRESDLVKAGSCLEIDTNQSGNTHISIKPDSIKARSGLTVNNGISKLYTIGFNNSFITTDTNSGINCKKEGSSFILSVDPTLLDDANVDYVFKDGLKKSGDTVSLDTNAIFSKILPGSGAVVSTNVLDNTTTLSFNQTTVTKPVPAIYLASYPLLIDRTETDGVLSRIEYRVDPSWLAKGSSSADLLSKTRSYFAHVTKKSNSTIGWQDTSEGLRTALACPILNLYKLFVNEDSDTIVGDANSLKIYKLFGSGQTEITLTVNLLPYYSLLPDSLGGDLEMGDTQKFDLYIILEHHLRKLLKDPAFTIASGERGLKYKVFEVGAELYSKRKTGDVQLPYYNREIELDSIVNPLDFAVVLPTFVPPTDWVSSVNGHKLRVTSGDVDYIIGNVRNGQKNSDVLIFPPNLDQSAKITLTSVAKERKLNGTELTFNVQDQYTGKSYTGKFLKQLGYDRDKNTDYISEVSGTLNPDHVRAFCRIYTNWEYADLDINKILYILGQNTSEFSYYFANYYYDDYKRGAYAVTFNSVFYENSKPKGGISVALDRSSVVSNGTLSVGVSVATPGLSLAVNTVLKELSVTITYLIDSRVGLTFDESKLFSNCCLTPA